MKLRASSLPGFTDCSRRATAKTFRKELEDDGYTFTALPPSVGAAVGTAAHKGVEAALVAKFYRRPATAADILGPAMEAFAKEMEPGAIWDDTTPNANTAQQQIRSLISAYINGPGKTVTPLRMADGTPAVELALQADAGNGWTLTGTLDLAEGFGVRDYKTGALSRPYHGQLGGYALLALSNKIVPKIKTLAIDFCKRAGKTKPQPPCETQVYPVQLSMDYALGIITRVKRDWAEYKQDGNLEIAFQANPCSMMCSEKYCPAYGTDFCKHGGIQKKEAPSWNR